MKKNRNLLGIFLRKLEFGKLDQLGPQLSPGRSGQAIAHNIHAVKSQGQSAYEGQEIEDTHTQSSLYILFAFFLHFHFQDRGQM